MSGKEIGQAMLLVGFLLSVAGIVEPSWLSSLCVSVFVIVGFCVWVFKAHDDWRQGYDQGFYESGKLRLEQQKENEANMYATGAALWKCGMPDCYCVNDFRFKEYVDD